MKKIIRKRNQYGFTLIEMVASIIILVTVGLIIVSIIVVSLRGTNKTNSLTQVKQNGYFAISQISRMLRDSYSVESIDGLSTSNCLTEPVISPAPEPTLVPRSSITIKDSKGTTTTISCDLNDSSPNISSTSGGIKVTLVNASAVKLVTCSFTCSQQSLSDPLLLGVSFSLTSIQNQSIFPDFTASLSAIPFSTSINMRNVSR